MNYIEHVYNGQQLRIEFKNHISFVDAEDIVRQIANGVFDDEAGYVPYRYDYYFWFLILHAYSNLDVESMSVDDLYVLIDDASFVQKAKKAISPSQLERIDSSAKKMIDRKLNEHPLQNVIRIATSLFEDIKNTAEKAAGSMSEDKIKQFVDGISATEEGKKIIDFIDAVATDK